MRARDAKVGAIVQWKIATGINGIIKTVQGESVDVMLPKTEQVITIPQGELMLIK